MSLEEGAECGLAQSLFDDLAFIKGDGSDVFIMNLHSSIDSQQLYETFSNFGAIADCKVPLDERGHSKRCGVIRFFDRKDADEVVEKVNAQYVWSRPRTPLPASVCPCSYKYMWLCFFRPFHDTGRSCCGLGSCGREGELS